MMPGRGGIARRGTCAGGTGGAPTGCGKVGIAVAALVRVRG